MKFITLTASEVVDGVKAELGKIENFPVPETKDEVMSMSARDDGCSDAEIVSAFNYGWKVRSQAKLRSGADPKNPVALFKKADSNRQAKILELAKREGLL